MFEISRKRMFSNVHDTQFLVQSTLLEGSYGNVAVQVNWDIEDLLPFCVRLGLLQVRDCKKGWHLG